MFSLCFDGKSSFPIDFQAILSSSLYHQRTQHNRSYLIRSVKNMASAHHLIDLSRRLEPNMQVYPGDPAFTCTPVASVEKDGCNVHSISLGSHTGTPPLLRENQSVDKPWHLIYIYRHPR